MPQTDFRDKGIRDYTTINNFKDLPLDDEIKNNYQMNKSFCPVFFQFLKRRYLDVVLATKILYQIVSL